MVVLASLGHRPVLQMDEERSPGVTTGKWRSGFYPGGVSSAGSVCITKVAVSMLCNMHIELSGKCCAGMKGSHACPIFSHSWPSPWHKYCFLIVCQCFTFYSMHFTLDFYVIKGKGFRVRMCPFTFPVHSSCSRNTCVLNILYI